MEALAVRFALLKMKQYQFYVDVVESDCNNLIDALNVKIRSEVYCDVVIVNILEMVDTSHVVKFEHIGRQVNQATHFVVHGLEFNSGLEFISTRYTPEHLCFFIELDEIS